MVEPKQQPAVNPGLRYAAQFVLLGITYYITARLSLHLSVVGKSVTPLWPPTGIAVVGLFAFGYRLWPAIAISAFAVNAQIGPSVGSAAGIAAGNTLAPLVATMLLRIAQFRPDLARTRDAAALVVVGLASMTVSATIGTASLHQSSAVITQEFWPTWAVWWAGDAMGVLSVAPFLFGLMTMRRAKRINWLRVGEIILLFGALIVGTAFLYNTASPVWVVVFPILVLIAGRFQQRGAGPAALLVITIASLTASRHGGPFSHEDLFESMAALQAFNAAVALTSFFFAAVVAERIVARVELEKSAHELYMREHHIAETLQRSLLPEDLPDIPDLAISARYIAAAEVEVGGDWYDIIPLHDGRLGVVIGDVAGHGVAAAAAMGQMRMALRAYALDAISPSHALERLNELIVELQPGAMATLLYAHLDPQDRSLTIAKAGHPPPLVITPDRESHFILGGLAPPIGVSAITRFEETVEVISPGSTVIFYTDGLIERRGESLDEGLRRLASVAIATDGDVEHAVDTIVETLVGDETFDDTAILAIRFVAVPGRPFAMRIPSLPAHLPSMRHALSRWLRVNGATEEESFDITVAATEACANAMQHAYGSSEGWIELRASMRDGTLTVAVRDFGEWKAPTDKQLDERGRGLPLMRGLMDTVSVASGMHGTEVTMARSLGAVVRNV